jgi:hypothetical protein
MVQLDSPDLNDWSYNPEVSDFGLGLIPLRSPLLWESLLISFPLPTKMFQFGRYRLINLCIQLMIMRGESHWVAPFGILRVKAFIQLTEDYRRYRVLHRLLMPRHPPAALNSLTIKK